MGALERVLWECSRCLLSSDDNSTGGLVGFTIEGFNDDGNSIGRDRKVGIDIGGQRQKKGMKLLKSGRFGHRREYVVDVAQKVGLDLMLWEDCVLRRQSGKDVYGAVVVLQKKTNEGLDSDLKSIGPRSDL